MEGTAVSALKISIQPRRLDRCLPSNGRACSCVYKCGNNVLDQGIGLRRVSGAGFLNEREETLRRVAMPESEVATAFKKRASVRTRLFEDNSALTGTTTASTPAKNIGAPELIPTKCSMPIPKGIPAKNVSENFIWCYLSVPYENTLRESSCPLHWLGPSGAYLDSIDRSNWPELQVKISRQSTEASVYERFRCRKCGSTV